MRPASLLLALLLALPIALEADAGDFNDDLARVDHALRNNPAGVSPQALDSCLSRRNFALQLYNEGYTARAERSLAFCKQLLRVSDRALPTQKKGPTMEEVQARAAREVERALALEPDLARGLEIYRECAACHQPEGWGMRGGSVPQLAGQHRSVVIKQLADIRAGNRDNPLMLPYASVEAIGGVQAVADVAGYIDTLEISVENGKGRGKEIELGEKLYGEHCASCHGARGEGDAEAFVPRIQAQHYKYLLRQFESIRDGKRRNANPEMVAQIQGFEDREIRAVLDYVSRLEPPPALQAPAGWRNPDFAQ